MLLLSIFQTVEFYIIAAFIAAAVIAAAAMPSRRSAARTFLYGGTLVNSGEAQEPEVIFSVAENGNLRIDRTGLRGMSVSGAYSLAVTIIGFDVTIEERLVPGRAEDEMVTSAYAVLDCLGRERYHFQYKSEATGRSAACSLNIRPGNTIVRPLT